jgi:hypothetical protein
MEVQFPVSSFLVSKRMPEGRGKRLSTGAAGIPGASNYEVPSLRLIFRNQKLDTLKLPEVTSG